MADEDQVCPRCSLRSPASAAWCDCGHVFDEERAATYEASGMTRPPVRVVLTWKDYLAVAGAFVLVGVASSFVLELYFVSVHGASTPVLLNGVACWGSGGAAAGLAFVLIRKGRRYG